MRYVAIFLICLMALTVGCANPYILGKPVEQARVEQVELGKTNTEQLIATLGKPDKIEPMKSGEEKYIYYYYKNTPRWWRPDDTQEQRLEVIMANGIVQRTNWVGQSIEKVK